MKNWSKINLYDTKRLSSGVEDTWLNVDGAKVYQVDIVKRGADTWYNVNQSATTTKTYVMIFEVGKDVIMQDISLTIWNGKYSIISTAEFINIQLKEKPTNN